MNIIILGATGIVGQEMISCLKEKNIPINSLRLAASARSAGKKMVTPFGQIEVKEVSKEVFENCDIALFAVDSENSLKWAPIAARSGAIVIDNSSAFRYEDDVPLVIPEVNPRAAFNHHGIIANPNCTTAIASVALWTIHQNFGLKKVIVSTYQAASGAGKEAMAELEQQARDFASGGELEIKNFQHQLLFNIIPHIDKFQKNGYTKEEMKMVWETRKIFGLPELQISCTAVRIPVMRAHSESIVVETERPIDPEKARELFKKTAGLEVVDDPENNLYPMPLEASGKYDVQIGRIRRNLIFGSRGLEFFLSGDQILKGAALNAVQIAELLIVKN